MSILDNTLGLNSSNGSEKSTTSSMNMSVDRQDYDATQITVNGKEGIVKQLQAHFKDISANSTYKKYEDDPNDAEEEARRREARKAFVKAQIEKIEGAIKSGPGTQPAPPAPVNLPTSYMSLGWSTNTKASWQSTISNAFFGRGPAVPDPSPKSVTEAADNDEKKQESSEDSHAEERKDDRVRRLGPRRASQPNIDPPPAHTLMKYTSRYLHTGPTVPRNVPLVYAQSVRNASHTADSQSNSSSTTHSPSTHNASSHRDSSNTSSAHDQTSQNDKHGQTPLMKRPSVRDSSPSKTKSSRGFFSMIPMVSERNLESINESSKDEEFEEESQSYKKVTKQSFPKSRLTVKRMSSSMIPRRASSRAIEEESVEV